MDQHRQGEVTGSEGAGHQLEVFANAIALRDLAGVVDLQTDGSSVFGQEEVVHRRFVRDSSRLVVAMVDLGAVSVGSGHRTVRMVLGCGHGGEP